MSHGWPKRCSANIQRGASIAHDHLECAHPATPGGCFGFDQDCGRDWNAAACEQASPWQTRPGWLERAADRHKSPGSTACARHFGQHHRAGPDVHGPLVTLASCPGCLLLCLRPERAAQFILPRLARHHSIALGPLSWRAAASALAALSFLLSAEVSLAIALGPTDLRASASALAARSRAACSSFTR